MDYAATFQNDPYDQVILAYIFIIIYIIIIFLSYIKKPKTPSIKNNFINYKYIIINVHMHKSLIQPNILTYHTW